MAFFDVFNGDADGICSLIQLRLHDPQDSILITGVKRDISLLNRIENKVSRADIVTVLDISMDKNQQPLEQILAQKTSVFYVDHHTAKKIPQVDNLTSLIDLDANTCTSLIVNKYLKNKYAGWAVVGSSGDNLKVRAKKLAVQEKIPAMLQDKLFSLGKYMNYNAYGQSYDDLAFAPEDLYREMSLYSSPINFLENDEMVFSTLESRYLDDFEKVNALSVEEVSPSAAFVIMPDCSWARRVSGVYANDLANNNPCRAHAIFTVVNQSVYQVSVRAPISNKYGADQFCLDFPTGGGRPAAAGINRLPISEFDNFIHKFKCFFK
jgi:hypothetical protein